MAKARMLFLVTGCALLGAACGGAFLEPPKPMAWGPLNDTGVTRCRAPDAGDTLCASAPGQDAHAGRDALAAAGQLTKTGNGPGGFDFTKLGASGLPLGVQNQPWAKNGTEAAGTIWHCVRDNHTGLVWEVKTNTASDLHYGQNTYSWYSSDMATNGLVMGSQNGGVCSQSACDTQAFAQQVNTEKLCGLSNWRLPSPVELLSIVDQRRINPPVDTAFFPNLSFNAYWTNQTQAQYADAAWYVYFTAGDNGVIAKKGVANVLLVSSAP